MAHPVRRIYTDTDCLRWSMDIARALLYLHSGMAGSIILHRDINPDNVMLTSRDPHKARAKLVDFGLHTTITESEDCLPDGTHNHPSVHLNWRLHPSLCENYTPQVCKPTTPVRLQALLKYNNSPPGSRMQGAPPLAAAAEQHRVADNSSTYDGMSSVFVCIHVPLQHIV